jgi:hypothetical protein
MLDMWRAAQAREPSSVMTDSAAAHPDALTHAVTLTAAGVTPGPVTARSPHALAWTGDLGWTGPQMVLAAPVTLPARKVRFTGARQWWAVQHQSAGVACHQRSWIVSPLTVRPEYAAGVAAIAGADHCCAGMFGSPSLDMLGVYRDLVRAHLPADCNHSWPDYEEGVYPLDVDRIAELVVDEIPERLDDLCVWPSAFEKMVGMVGRWKLLILGDNCD